MLGDADGVLAVPRATAAEILERTRAKLQAEEKQMAAIENGSIDRSWVDKALKERGCVFVD
jgi:regulator of RNase E activity RraA